MKYLYVANWKMNMPLGKSIAFCSNNKSKLFALASKENIVICPSFIALSPLAEIVKQNNISLGAQNCCEHEKGAYTGEVSAQSLAEVGAQYCIIGHSERRILYGETTESIVKKALLLYAENITPIICIGETQKEFEKEETYNVLETQLKPILAAITKNENCSIIIAYEPIWSIGTGIIPENAQLTKIFNFIGNLCDKKASQSYIRLLYGGSVNENNIHQLKQIKTIGGFLVGNASTTIESLEKIIDQ